MHVTDDKEKNIGVAVEKIEKAVAGSSGDSSSKPHLVMLPEIWNSPYAASEFPKYCEPIPEKGESLLGGSGGSILKLKFDGKSC
jgi:omega-amidase